MMTYEQWEKKRKEQRIFKKVLNAVFMTVLVLALLVISTVALFRALDTPEVEFSWETKQCVRVKTLLFNLVSSTSYLHDLNKSIL